MDRINIIITAIAALLLTFNCKSEHDIKTKTYQTITIDKIPEDAGLKFSEVFDSIKIVPLETTDESLIGRIDKIIYYEDRIYILDQVIKKSVLVFDTEGNYLFNLGKNGNGPGEYNEPNDMTVDRFSNKIMIYCNNSRKILSYNFDGSLFEEIKFDYLFDSFSVIGPEKLALYIDRTNYVDNGINIKHHLLIVNKSGKILRREFEFDKLTKGGSNFFNNNISSYSVSPGYSNSIFKVSPDDISLKYRFDFGKHTIPDDFFKYPKNSFNEELKHSDYAFLKSFSESENYLLFTFVYKSMIYSGFYFKKKNRLCFANLLINDFAGLVKGATILTGNHDVFISYFDSYQIGPIKDILSQSQNNSDKIKNKLLNLMPGTNTDIKVSKYKELTESATFSVSKKQYEVIQSVDAEDNPVLIFHYMRKSIK